MICIVSKLTLTNISKNKNSITFTFYRNNVFIKYFIMISNKLNNNSFI